MQIGSINIDKPLSLAPMEDVTELPFRIICKRLGADIVYTEFTSSEGLIREIPRVLEKIEICEEERPVSIQIFGGRPDAMDGAAKVVERYKPDFIDINCGCWLRIMWPVMKVLDYCVIYLFLNRLSKRLLKEQHFL